LFLNPAIVPVDSRKSRPEASLCLFLRPHAIGKENYFFCSRRSCDLVCAHAGIPPSKSKSGSVSKSRKGKGFDPDFDPDFDLDPAALVIMSSAVKKCFPRAVAANVPYNGRFARHTTQGAPVWQANMHFIFKV
jgi:hypothetical protein